MSKGDLMWTSYIFIGGEKFSRHICRPSWALMGDVEFVHSGVSQEKLNGKKRDLQGIETLSNDTRKDSLKDSPHKLMLEFQPEVSKTKVNS